MRKLGLMATVGAVLLAQGCDHGGGIGPGHDDLSVVGDMAMPSEDMDLSVPMDLTTSPDLASSDLAIPLDAMTYVSFGDFVEMMTTAICDQMVRCGRLPSAAANPDRYQACKDEQRPRFVAAFDAETEVSKGRLKLNVAVCPPTLLAGRCDYTDYGKIFDVGPCGSNSFVVAAAASGTACLSSLECQNGFCNHGDAGAPDVTVGCAGGACAPFKASAGVFDGGARSCTGFGTECDPSVSFCNGGVCVPSAAVDEACDGNTPCQRGLYCKGLAYAGSGTCKVPSAPGNQNDPCDVGQTVTGQNPPCATGLYCQHPDNLDMGTVSTMGTCQPKKARGTSCNPNELFSQAFVYPGNIVGEVCEEGYYCVHLPGDGLLGKCRLLGGTGAACDPTQAGFNASGCDDTFYCLDSGDGIHGTCQPMPRPNQVCDPQPTGVPCTPLFIGNCIAAPGADAGTCQTLNSWGDRCDPASFNQVSDSCFGSGACEPANNPATSRCVNVCP